MIVITNKDMLITIINRLEKLASAAECVTDNAEFIA